MNLPNRLTLTRMILTPFVFLWYFSSDVIRSLPVLLYCTILILLYAVMELTDLIDGKIARKRHLVTDLGKVMDPFADGMCHITFFLCFTVTSIMPVWAFVIILWRELLQCFMRMLLMGKGKAMPANIFGKSKTCLYAFTSIVGFASRILIICSCFPVWMRTTMLILSGLSALASAVSFIIYLYNTFKSGVLSSLTR